jgi:hypothetical protein
MTSKITLALISTFISLNGLAQISITSADMPVVNDTFRLSQNIPAQGQNPFNLSQTGANYIWDFTNLTSIRQDIDTFFSPLQTPIAYNLVFTNLLLYPDNYADLAQRSQTLPQQPGGGGGGGGGGMAITIKNAYDFIRKTSSKYSIVGNAFEINDVPSANPFDGKDIVYQFPLTYQNQFSSNSKYEIHIPSFVDYYHRQVRSNEVDGWGKLYTPAGEFDVIRVKSTIAAMDSIIFLGGPIPFTFNLPSTTVEYKWLAKTYGVPVLQINVRTTSGGFGGGGNQTVVSKVSYIDTNPPGTYKYTPPSGLEDLAYLGIQIYPNPANDMLYVTVENNLMITKDVVILDLTGKELIRQKLASSKIQIDLSALSKGLYLVSIGNTVGKLVKN